METEELTISAMLPPPGNGLPPRLVLARGGFSLTLDSSDQAKLKEAIIALEMEAAREDTKLAGPETPLVEDDEDDEIVAF